MSFELFSTEIKGTVAEDSVKVKHNLNTLDIIVSVWENGVLHKTSAVALVDKNTIEISPPPVEDARIVVVGEQQRKVRQVDGRKKHRA